MRKHIYYLFALCLVLISSWASPAIATEPLDELLGGPILAREICGDGIDNDASGTVLLCPAPDMDHDGYWDDFDCNPTNRKIFAGIPVVTGCSAGQIKMCQADGTYTACTSIDIIDTLVAGGLQTYVISSAEDVDDCSGAGTVADPKGLFCFSDPSLTGYISLEPGDVVAFLNLGNYPTAYWTDTVPDPDVRRQLYVNNKDGTEANPITLLGINYPRIPNAGTLADAIEIPTLYVINSAYVHTIGMGFDGTADSYGNAHIFYFDSPHPLIEGNLVEKLNGIVGSNNIACIKVSGSDSLNPYVLRNYTRDCFAIAGPTNDNNYAIVFMDADAPVAQYNVSMNTLEGGAGHCIVIKHGVVGGLPGDISFNICAGFWGADIIWEQPKTTVSFNYIDATMHDGEPILYAPWGAHPDFDSADVHHNTVIGGPAFNLVPDPTYNVRAHVMDFHHNTVVDDRASDYILGASDGFIRIYEYGSDASYLDVIVGEKVTSTNNCYFNTEGTELGFVVYGDNSVTLLGELYESFEDFQLAGFEAGSFNEDPELDEFGQNQNPNCVGRDWLSYEEDEGGGGDEPGLPPGKPKIISSTWRYR